MNLRTIYEIFYPGKSTQYPFVWKEIPKYRSKKEFYEEIFPMELRWLNIKLWNDKARRSRFFTDSTVEKNYVSALKEFLIQNPMVISRMESKCYLMIKDDLFPPTINQIFFQLAEQEQITFSSAIKQYLMNKEGTVLKNSFENVIIFLILYAIFPSEINQLYMPYLYRKENAISYNTEEKERDDRSLFQYEFPPDMSVHNPGEWITHTWVIKNVGKIPWKHRRLECVSPPDWLNKESRSIEIAEVVHPGDTVSFTVHFSVPDIPGHYTLCWKMKNDIDELVFCDKLGLGLHFTVIEVCIEDLAEEGNNYQILEEKPAIPTTLSAGNLYKHSWMIENTGTIVWENYYCECINGDVFGYAKNELRISMKKKIEPGERVVMQIEFVTPPVEGLYKLIWRIMNCNGKPVFAKGRQLEVTLNLI